MTADPGATDAALEATGITKRYGAREALRGVDVTARAGEVHGLLGPNGAGKTTLLRVLLGLVRPDAGTVRMLGRDARDGRSPTPPGVAGFVETPQFYPYLSARRNLALLARLDGVGPAAPGHKGVDGVLEEVGLSPHAGAKVGGFSAGMRQRLGLAAALLRAPKLLLLDEPTSTLDPEGAREFRERVRRLASQGVAVLLSSHDMTEVDDLCGSLTIVREGRVVFDGSLDDLRKRAPDAEHRLRTSDDPAALTLATDMPGLEVTACEGGLDVRAGEAALDRYVIALGRAGVAVRALELRARSLEALFLQLMSEAA